MGDLQKYREQVSNLEAFDVRQGAMGGLAQNALFESGRPLSTHLPRDQGNLAIRPPGEVDTVPQ